MHDDARWRNAWLTARDQILQVPIDGKVPVLACDVGRPRDRRRRALFYVADVEAKLTGLYAHQA